MPGKGFMARYEGTTRIDLGDGYWVDVKKVLTYAESEAAEKAGLSFHTNDPTQSPDGAVHTKVAIEPQARLFEQVLSSIVGWNLDEPDGTIWSTAYNRELEKGQIEKFGKVGERWKMPLRKNLERLPKPEYDLIAAIVGKANSEPTKEEVATFHAGSELGATGEQVGAPDDSEVLPGGGLLATVGAESGSPPADGQATA